MSESPHIVLASTSPYRRELLSRLRIPFEVDRPDADEARLPGEGPEALVRRLAEAKARSLQHRYPHSLIIGSDQVAVAEGEILGKPGGREAAIAQLTKASGKSVTFLTGLCLLDSSSDLATLAVEPFDVHFRQLSKAQIERYVDLEEPYDCAGSFKSEGYGICLFERLDGADPNSLIGLPLIRLVTLLNQAGVSLP